MVDDDDKSAANALVSAVDEGHTEAVRGLLAAGANPEVHTGDYFDGTRVSALQIAAARGFKDIVQLLLDSGANPEAHDVLGHGEPLFVAASRGHEEVASLIRSHIARSRERRTREYFESHGYTILPDRMDRPQFYFSGSQLPTGPEEVMRCVSNAEIRVAPDIPFTVFDGWLKQLDQDRMTVLLLEALDALFPIFTTLGMPRPEHLPNLPQPDPQEKMPRVIRFARERRFAGDHLLPRGRYHTLCTESGNDERTLCNELFSYRDVRESDEIELTDPLYPPDKRTVQPPYDNPATPLMYVSVTPGAGGMNRFLHRAGLGQKAQVFLFPVRLAHVRLEKVVDLRQPASQSWFVQFFSDFVDDISEWTRTDQRALRWWPNRPKLDRFEQILPSLLTQELGGNAFTKAVGSWLRRAGADALIYPSARSDSSLTLTDGIVTGFRGWNLVDYRGAEPPQRQIFLDVDNYWPDRVRMGPGMDLRLDLPSGLFDEVSIVFSESGVHAGSFEVKNLEAAARRLYEQEIASLRQRRPFKPWWLR
jgi:hypothetical protein